jgi:hypothetical protein
MIPYKTSDESPRTRLNPGPVGDEDWVLLILISDIFNYHKPNNYKTNSNNGM